MGARARAGALRDLGVRRSPRRPRPRHSRPACRGGRGRRVRRGHARRRRPPRGVQRLPPPGLSAGPSRTRLRAGLRGRRGAALPVPLVDLLAGRPAAEGAAHRGRRPRPGRLLPAPGGCRGVGGLRLRQSHARGRRALRRRRGEGRGQPGQLRHGLAGDRTAAELRRGGQLEGPRRELQRVLPLWPGAPRAGAAGAGVRRGRYGPRVGGRHPAPRGRVDVHDVGHHEPLAAARAVGGREGPAQGRARLPEPDAVVLGRPRGGVRAAAASRSTGRGSSARCCSRATPSRPPTTTRPTPATSGTWSTSRTGRSASRCSAGCRRGPTRTAGSPRWRTTARTSGAGCCRG